METDVLHRKISFLSVFFVLFQVFAPIILGPPVYASVSSFSYSYQITDNTFSETNIDAASYNGAGYVVYERSGTIYFKQGIGQEEVVGSGSSPTIEVYSGIPHVIYFSDGKIKYTFKSDSSWVPPIDLTAVVNPTSADFKIDSSGYIHLVYSKNSTENYDDLYYSTNTSGNFVETNFCHGYYWSGFGGQYCGHPVGIQVDSSNYFHIAYKSGWRDSTPSYSTQSMAYYTNNPSGNAGSAGYNWNTSAVTTSKNNIALDTGGNVYIIYGAGGNRYIGKVSGGVWNEISLGSGFSDYSITSDTGIIGVAYNDGSNNLNYIYDTGGGFGSAETVATGTSHVITFGGGGRFIYSLQSDGNDDEVQLKSANSVYVVPGQIDNSDSSFVSAPGGSVGLSSLEVGGVYILMNGSTVASSGALVATDSSGSLSLNPLAFPNYGSYTLTLSGSYNSTTTTDIDSVTLYVGPFDYQDLYVNQIASALLSGGIVTNLTDITYANVQAFSNLYFENTGMGKIAFSAALDLTNSGTILFLQDLPNKLDIAGGNISFDPTDSDFANYGAQLYMYFDTGSTFVTGISDPESFVVKTSTGQVLDSSDVLSNIHGACGVGDSYCTLVFDTAHFTVFDLRPVLTDVHITSNSAYSGGTLAKDGDQFVLTFTGSESLAGIVVTFDGVPARNINAMGGTYYSAASELSHTGNGLVTFSIDYQDLTGNTGTTITGTTDGSSVTLDTILPTANIMYSTTEVTAQNVIATLTGASEDVTVTNNGGSTMYSFTENGNFVFEFEDAAGNTGSANAVVTNINTSQPTITLIGSGTMSIEQGDSYSELGATWTDQTDGTGTVSILSGIIDTNVLGTQQVEYLYINSLGVTGSTIRTVNIVDTVAPIAPTITTPSMTTSGSSLANIIGTGEVDTTIYLYKNGSLVCGGNTVNGSGSFVIVNFSSCLALNEGINTFTAYARDTSGNSSSTGNTLTVTRDSTPPSILYTEVKNITTNQADIEFAFTETHFVNQTSGVELYNGATLVSTGGIAEYSGNIGYTTFSGLDPDTTYTFTLSLTDDGGNNITETGSFTTTLSRGFGEVPTDIYETGGILFGSVEGSVGSGTTFYLSGNNAYIYSDPNDSDSASGSLTLSGVDIIVLSGSWNGVLLPPSIIDNNNPLSATGSEIGSSITVVQTVQAGAEGSSLGSIGGYFEVSFMIPGFASGTVFHIYRSEDGSTWVPVTPDGTCTLDADLMCTFRTDHLSVFAPVFDSIPDSFSFTAKAGAELGTSYSSNTITVSGINTGTTISVTGGEYQIGTGAFTGIAGTVVNGDQITVRGTSSSSYTTTVNVALTIGGVSATYSIATKSAPSGGSTGGGGGGSTPTMDVCPSGDTSGSAYDGRCTSSSQSTGTGSQGATNTGTMTSSGTPPSFPDIDDSFARDYIEELYSLSIISGYPDGTFGPDKHITRAEWIKMVIGAFQISLDTKTGNSFTDIPDETAWIVPYINTAKQFGIVDGQWVNGKLIFRPNDLVTRVEALKMAFEASGEDTTSLQTLPFMDSDFVSWMLPYVIRASELGIVNGQWIDGKLLFRPNGHLTRGEAAKILFNFLRLGE